MIKAWQDVTASIGVICHSVCGGFTVGLFFVILSVASASLYSMVFAPQQITLGVASLSLATFSSSADGSFSFLLTGHILTAFVYFSSATALVWYTVELIRSQRLHQPVC